MSEHSPGMLPNELLAGVTSKPRLSGSRLRVARAGWLILALAAAAILVTSLPGYVLRLDGQIGHLTAPERTTILVIFSVLSGLASLASALLSFGLAWTFFWRRFEEPAAAALSFYLLIFAVVMAGPFEVWNSYWTNGALPAEKLQGALLATPTVALFLLFPNGRFVPAWTRWVLLLTIPWNISLFFLPGFDPASLSSMTLAELGLISLWFVSFLAVGLYAQVIRYRRVSSPVEKQQTKWVMFGFALWLAYISISTLPYLYLGSLPPDSLTPWWAPASVFGWFLSLNIVPVSLAIAVTRHRLWDIDVVINRTLVYGALTACVIAIYALVVVGTGTLFQAQGNWLISLVATGLVAVLFQPIRERLQQRVNRLVYGQRDEPFEVLARLGQQLAGTLAPEMVYPTIVETTAKTLKLPYVAIAVRHGEEYETVKSFGRPRQDLIEYPLVYQGEIVGHLQVAPRGTNQDFTQADQRLLRSIARQAGTAVHVVQLTADLLHSRQRLVTTREEERRRLRRDLHDGLGPTLAAHMLKIGSARALLHQDPAAADQLLMELENNIEATLGEVRRLVYNLRPPALDQLGLAGAIRAQAADYGDGQRINEQPELEISLEIPDKMPALPAAVEVAAYHIVREGLTNVVRHAQAQACVIALSITQNGLDTDSTKLRLSIWDDGRGLEPPIRAGVGLTSMRERAEEVGGHFTIEADAEKGTRISAELPLKALST